ncbi:MAG TPA: glycosyltransferase family 4 protein [Flavisolibacter sp.]|jgi:glycosyltransferase involved in cell wall biosynthesis|nr:glycosyltransferase family 4 protein [Flavisolibacter sp.]
MSTPDILFLTLRTFSATGGIEKVSRLAGKALCEEATERGMNIQVYSAYDQTQDVDSRYIPATVFRGFSGSRKTFAWHSLHTGRKARVVVLSHINLLSVGYAIKKLSPATKLVLLAHGIEVWSPLAAWKRKALQACDKVLAVSSFTRERMRELFGLDENKLQVLNNCIDPFLTPLPGAAALERLRQKYGLARKDKIVLTLTRLEEKERPKGYDDVMQAVKSLQTEYPGLRYFLVGKATAGEKARLDGLIRDLGLESTVILPGFVPEEDLAAYFALADVFIMPSRKEGFGIVFIEALYYGLPVIAGNRDGSVDALAGGKFGQLVDPGDGSAVRTALQHCLEGADAFLPERESVLAHFGFPVYKKKLWQALAPLTSVSKKGAGYRKKVVSR